MATAGLALLSSEGSDSFTCVRATSVGDVFAQDFHPTLEMYDLTDISQKKEEMQNEAEEWAEWEKNEDRICSINKSKLACPVFPNETTFDCEYDEVPFQFRIILNELTL